MLTTFATKSSISIIFCSIIHGLPMKLRKCLTHLESSKVFHLIDVKSNLSVYYFKADAKPGKNRLNSSFMCS